MSYEVPTAMFQSVNAFAVMLCGMVLAWLVKENISGNRTVRIWGKFALGLGLMSAGFCILTLSARWSATYGHSSMPLMVLGLAVMGFAELFIDPVAMSQITRIEIPGVTGVLTGIYMLLSGAIANYLAGLSPTRRRRLLSIQPGRRTTRLRPTSTCSARLPGARWPASAWCWQSGSITPCGSGPAAWLWVAPLLAASQAASVSSRACL